MLKLHAYLSSPRVMSIKKKRMAQKKEPKRAINIKKQLHQANFFRWQHFAFFGVYMLISQCPRVNRVELTWHGGDCIAVDHEYQALSLDTHLLYW